MMAWYEKLVSFLTPGILLRGTPWEQEWNDQQQSQFVRSCRIAYPIVAVGYAANYLLFDIPMGLEPSDFWLKLRLGVSAALLAVAAFYNTSLAKKRYYKVPAYLSAFAFCAVQAWVTIWYGKEAWVFFFLFVLLTALVLRLNSLESLVWTTLVIGSCSSVLLESGLSITNFMSGTIVTVVASLMIRSNAYTDAQLFLSRQQNFDTQKQLRAASDDYAERMKSFIPKVIANRMTSLMEERRLTVVEASIEALKAKKKHVTCLFTDIRGYTAGSRDLEGFVANSVMPEVTSCSDAIEALDGIPRKVGDLIFAYFDHEQRVENALHAIAAAIEISRTNESMNKTVGATNIRRYILISSGHAIVGNFGALDSSVEITALGSPVNFLSRLDDATKDARLSPLLSAGDVLLDEETASLLSQYPIYSNFEKLDLDTLGVKIRDYPEVCDIYRLPSSDAAYERSQTALSLRAG